MQNPRINEPYSPSLNEAKTYIYSLDFSRLIDKLVNHGDWIRPDAEETCLLYRNYLFLIKKYGTKYQSLPPSEDIDDFWHNHILDTHSYIKDCDSIFGHYLHHYPYLGIDDKTDFVYLNNAFDTTQRLYLQEFGALIPPTKSKYPRWLYYLMKRVFKLD